MTNPPFSKFIELFVLINKYNKKYLLIGNQNAITYKEIFPYIINGQAWIGYQFGEMSFKVPSNWQMVIDIANMLKDLDIPIQTIDFGHPNFRDSNLEKYNEGKKYYWKKEHQIKIYANEFLPIGFNIVHKQKALIKYAEELLNYLDKNKTHRFYWGKTVRRKAKPIHPMENDDSLPLKIRGKHYESWTDLAKDLGHGI